MTREIEKTGVFRLLGILACVFSIGAGVAVESKTSAVLVIKGGRLHTMTQGIIENGTVVVREGKIMSVGRDIAIPERARVIDALNCDVLPGFFDAFTHLGTAEPGEPGQDYDEASSPLTPQLRIIDAVNPENGYLEPALRTGITTFLCAPGAGNVLAGQSAVLQPYGDRIEEMSLRFPAGMHAGLCEAPKLRWGGKGVFPMTRMGQASLLRRALLDAERYIEGSKSGGRTDPSNAADFQAAALGPVVKGEIPLIVQADRLDDILTALRIAREFDIRLILNHGAEACQAADLLVKNRVPVLLGPKSDRLSRDETLRAPVDLAARLHEAGVVFAFQTGSHKNFAGLLDQARAAVAAGLDQEAALEALTIAPARIFRVADRIGSLEPGKSADIVIYDGPPLDPGSRIKAVLIRGRLIADSEL